METDELLTAMVANGELTQERADGCLASFAAAQELRATSRKADRRGKFKKYLKEFFKDLKFEVEDRCKGHMAPTDTYLVISLDGEKLQEVQIRHEECPGEWGE
jgi:hypothetical protein